MFCCRTSLLSAEDLPAYPSTLPLPGSWSSAPPSWTHVQFWLSFPDPRQQRASRHDGKDLGSHPFPDDPKDQVNLEWEGLNPFPFLSTKLVYITSFSFFFDTSPSPNYSQMGEKGNYPTRGTS